MHVDEDGTLRMVVSKVYKKIGEDNGVSAMMVRKCTRGKRGLKCRTMEVLNVIAMTEIVI